MNFNIDYFDFIRKLIPWFLRQPRIIALARSIIKPLQTVNDGFVVFRDAIAFKLAFNSQIIYLEKYLNTVYPNPYTYPNNIHILDGANVEFNFVWNDIENQAETWLFNDVETSNPFYFENYSEQTSGVFSYIIRVPNYVTTSNDYNGQDFNETVMRSRVNFYNLAGKTYNIEYF